MKIPTLFDSPPPAPAPGTIEGRFQRFHAERPEVYAELVKLARAFRRRGFEQYSIKGLYEEVRGRLRRQLGPDEDLAMNNDYTPLYARLIMRREPDLKGFFRTRERRAE